VISQESVPRPLFQFERRLPGKIKVEPAHKLDISAFSYTPGRGNLDDISVAFINNQWCSKVPNFK
jgi:hypothetical protein